MNRNKAPLVSVIVPCYKQARFLPETLDSVLAQSYDKWECVIVNDGSPDNTEEIAKQYCARDVRFKYVYQCNSGVSVARNVGIYNSKGDYILPLDSDDLIAPTYLEKAVEVFVKETNVKLVYCKAEWFGATTGAFILDDYDYERFIYYNCLFSSCVYRKRDFYKTGGYSKILSEGCEDWDFYLSLLKKDDSVYRIDEVLFYYRSHGVSRNSGAKENMDIILKKIFDNHKDIYSYRCEDIMYYAFNYYVLLRRYNNLKNSPYYKVGLFVLSPYRVIRHVIRRVMKFINK